MKNQTEIRAVIAIISFVTLGGCALSSQVNSHYVSNERVQLKPVTSTAQGILPIGPLVASLAPSVINFGTAKLEEIYTRESEKYVASYSATRVGADFYISDTSLEFSFDALEINRWASDRPGAAEQQASSIRLRWVGTEEHSLFSLVPERIQVYKAKAKMRMGDPNLDLNVTIVLEGYWQLKNGEVKSRVLGDSNLLLTGIRLGETYTLNSDGQESWLEDTNGNRSNYNVRTGWIAPVPVSVSEQGNRMEYARGNYVITVTVTETDDYGERVARFGRDIHDARGVLIDVLQQTVD